MKRSTLLSIFVAASLLLSSCGGGTYTCTDPLGCVAIAPEEAIKIGAELTLTGTDSTTGIDSMRAIEIAISHKGALLGHAIEIIKGDDLCEENAGREAATQLAANPQIVGVIGANCSSASVPAAKILSDAGMVLISPSSTAPSLTNAQTHQAGFLRTIYNDKVQGSVVADFVFTALGARTMITIHDGTPYSEELQETACAAFGTLGGECIQQAEIHFGQDDIASILRGFASLDPDALYFPIYTEAGIAITLGAKDAGLQDAALVSSDGLLNAEFLTQSTPASEGMYISGPSTLQIDPAFLREYKTRYGEDPIDVFHAQAYDAVMMLCAAIEKVAVREAGGTIYIPRQALRDALYATKDFNGLAGALTCNEYGDCADPQIVVFQVLQGDSVQVFP